MALGPPAPGPAACSSPRLPARTEWLIPTPAPDPTWPAAAAARTPRPLCRGPGSATGPAPASAGNCRRGPAVPPIPSLRRSIPCNISGSLVVVVHYAQPSAPGNGRNDATRANSGGPIHRSRRHRGQGVAVQYGKGLCKCFVKSPVLDCFDHDILSSARGGRDLSGQSAPAGAAGRRAARRRRRVNFRRGLPMG